MSNLAPLALTYLLLACCTVVHSPLLVPLLQCIAHNKLHAYCCGSCQESHHQWYCQVAWLALFHVCICMQILSWYPRILVYPNFIDRERAQHIIKLATSRMKPSDLSWRPSEKRDDNQQIRTSSGVFLSR